MIYQDEEVYLVYEAKDSSNEDVSVKAVFTSRLEAEEYAVSLREKHKKQEAIHQENRTAFQAALYERIGAAPSYDELIRNMRLYTEYRRRESDETRELLKTMPAWSYPSFREYSVQGPLLLNPNRKDWVEEPEEEQDFTEADKEWIATIDGHTLQPHEL